MIQRLLLLLKSALSARCLPWILALLALVIMSGTLGEGFLMDDYFHRAKLLGRLHEGSGDFLTVINDMFTLNRTPERLTEYQESGLIPWWASDSLRVSNWRPLTSLTHWLDYRFYPHWPAGMHAHSLLWFAGAVLAVTLLYRKLSGAVWIAGLAALMYLCDEANYYPVLWIANRNELIAVTFGVWAIYCHHQWRSVGAKKYLVGSTVLFLLSLLATEAGIAVFAYLIAYAFCLDGDPWRQRWKSLMPAFAILVLWHLVYNGLGHGVESCGAIIDPVHTPLAFARVAITRAPLLLMGAFGLAQPDFYLIFNPALKRIIVIASSAGLVVIGLLLIPVLRKDRTARFYGMGMFLSVWPICVTMPSTRNLMFVAIGGFGLVAHLLAFLAHRDRRSSPARFWRGVMWVLVVSLLLIHIPVALGTRLFQPKMTKIMIDLLVPDIPLDDNASGISDKRVIVVNAPNPFGMTYLPLIRQHQGKPLPLSIHTLAPSFAPLDIERPDIYTLVIRARAKNLFTCAHQSPFAHLNMFQTINRIWNADWDHIEQGQTKRLSHLSIQVRQVDELGIPLEVAFIFDRPLDDDVLVWITYDYQESRYRPFCIPGIGETRLLAGTNPSQTSNETYMH